MTGPRSIAAGTLFATVIASASTPAATPSDSGHLGWQRNASGIASHLYAEEAHKSLAFSPESLRQVLYLLRDGARGSAAREIASLLGDESPATSAPVADDEVVLATAVFVKQPLQIAEAYARLVATSYHAEATQVREADGGRVVDHWVSKATRGRIQQLLGSESLSADLVAVNALYFEGTWETPFDPKRTIDQPFFGSAGELKVPFMQVEGDFRHTSSEDLQAVALPYAGGRYVLEIWMPGTGRRMPMENLLSDPQIHTTLQDTAPRTGRVELPRFEIESRFELNPALRQAGIEAAFDPQRADFSAMTRQAAPLSVSRVIQKVRVLVNEKGTIAAAATAAEMTGGLDTGPEFAFTANRPFAFILRRIADGATLILGVYDPTPT